MKKNNYRLLAAPLVAILACVTAASVALAQERESRSVILREGAKLSSAQGSQSGQPLALASADFDEDGVPDLIASYASAQGAWVVMRRGNVDAIYPNSPEAKVRKQNGQFTEAAFLAEARSFALPEAADLIGAGDFDADGHSDIVAARTGGDKLFWLRGDGRGNFAKAEGFELHGTVTALVAGEMNRADGLTDVAVGFIASDGPRALVFESPEGALRGAPESFKLSAPASALALGQLDDDHTLDLAIASGNEVTIVHGRDRKLSQDADRRAEVSPARLSQTVLPSVVSSIAVGDFAGDHLAELAVLTADGAVRILERAQGELRSSEVMTFGLAGNASRLLTAKVSSLPKDDLVLFGGSNDVRIVTTREADRFDKSGKVTKVGSSGINIAASLPSQGEVTAILPMRLNRDALRDLVLLHKNSAAPSVLVSQPASTYVVNALGNSSDVTPGNGVCLDNAGNCTFPAAIQEANAHAGADTIEFNIPGAGPPTVSPSGRFFTDATTVDGTTQPGGRVEVASGDFGEFLFYGGNSVVRGVATYFAPGNVASAIYLASSGNVVEGNYIGFKADETLPSNRTNVGISFRAEFGTGHNNLIGGTTAPARNVISNCNTAVYLSNGTSGNTIRGNYIGTNVAGTAAVRNFNEPIRDTQANGLTIGGTAAGAGNVISGNTDQGRGTISIENAISTGATLVQGNFIGTTADGMQPLSNSGSGITVGGSAGPVTIGGTTPAARNVISANGTGIVLNPRNAGGSDLVQGNFIGTNAAGTGALPNLGPGVRIAGNSDTLGGTASGAGNLISGNGGDGILISPEFSNTVQGNFIGTDVTGTVAIPNFSDGVEIQANGFNQGRNNLIGGTSPEARNVISGNRENGIRYASSGDAGPNRAEGNYIGVNRFGTGALGNGQHGVFLQGSPNNVGGSAPGAGNLIAFNGGDGIASSGGNFYGAILSNSIFSNAGLGIDLGNNGVTPFQGSTFGQYPVINSVSSTDSDTTVTGKLRTRTDGGNLPQTIQFFSSSSSDPSGHGEGQTFVGQTTISAGSGADVPFSAVITPPVPPGRYISAVAVGQGDTNNPNSIYSSELSFCVRVAGESTPENTPLHLNIVSPMIGGDTGVLTTTIVGEGIREGVTVVLRRAGEADIIGVVRSVSSDGSAAEVTFDLTGRAHGGWEVVVTNLDGSFASIGDGFTIEAGRTPRIWSYIAGPSALRRDSERPFFIIYGNSGNVDVSSPVLELSGPAGTKLRFISNDLQQESPLRIYATGAPGSAGTLKAGAGHVARVLVQHAPGANELELRLERVDFEGTPFDWDRLATEVPAGRDPAVWAATVNRAHNAMGDSWDEVMTNIRLVTYKVEDTSTVQNFDGLFLYLVAVFSDQFEPAPISPFAISNLAAPSAPARPESPQGPPPLTLDPVGTVNANPSRVYILTHGAGGVTNPDGSVRRPDIVEMAQHIKDREPNANVYLPNYSAEAQKQVLGSGGTIPDAWEIAKGVDTTGDLLALKMINEGIPPNKTTMISESAGGPVNIRAARKLQELGFGKVDKGLLLNPPNEMGGFRTDAKGSFNKSLSLHTDSLFDSQSKIADFDVELETPDSAGQFDKHTGSWDFISGRLAQGDGSLLNLDLPVLHGPAGNWDGIILEDGSYQPLFNERPQDRIPEGAVPPTSPLDIIIRPIVASLDPNDKAGPGGAGAQRYVTSHLPFAYAISFENKASASAPAQDVVVTDQLDVSKFDLSTFQLGAISFGNSIVVVPPTGLSDWTTDIDVPQRNLVVRVIAVLDKTTGMITWRFISLDPVTMQPTEDPLAGFLPPNQAPQEGEGAVTFTVSLKSNQSTGTQISNQARIVFDTNAPIDTPAWFNTIDDLLPSSNVLTLNSTQSSRRFQVSWSGSDTGAGVANYTIYVSENGGPYAVWLNKTSSTTAIYDGRPSSGYAFYSIAQDGANNVEDVPASADASTTTPSSPPVQLASVVSTKQHGAAGWFAIDLPISGTPGIECRSGGVNGNYTLIFNFATPLTRVDGASVTGSGAFNGGAIGADAHQYIVNLTGVASGQYLEVTLEGAGDEAGNYSDAVPNVMGVLVGDTTASGDVNSSDVADTKAQSGAVVTQANCRQDVTANGLINSSDVAFVKLQSGTAIATSPQQAGQQNLGGGAERLSQRRVRPAKSH